MNGKPKCPHCQNIIDEIEVIECDSTLGFKPIKTPPQPTEQASSREQCKQCGKEYYFTAFKKVVEDG